LQRKYVTGYQFITREAFCPEESPRQYRDGGATEHDPTSDQFQRELHLRVLPDASNQGKRVIRQQELAPIGKYVDLHRKWSEQGARPRNSNDTAHLFPFWVKSLDFGMPALCRVLDIFFGPAVSSVVLQRD
jgi:hypothetical protein